MTWLKRIILLIMLGMLVFPSFQRRFQVISPRPLNGYFESFAKPVFNRKTWLTGEYQDQYRQYAEDSIGFKPDLVRLFNQLDFSLFSISHAERLVVGKNDYLFAENYIREYLGIGFVGKPYIDEKIKELKYVQDYLWKNKKILLLVIFPPDKGTFMPEYLPDRYRKKKKNLGNYDYYALRCAEAGINHIDFNRYFRLMKDTSRYPLYPKTGIHWSSYGSIIAADSMIRYLEKKLETRLRRIVWDSMEMAGEPGGLDNDIGRTMNLIWEIPHSLTPRPRIHFDGDSVKPRPAALFIGDSFYWNWYYPGIIRDVFSNEEFWYYDKEVYPESFKSPLNTGQFSLKEAIERQNIIVLVSVNGGAGDLGYGFVDRAFYLYDTSAHNRIRFYVENMKKSEEYVKLLEQKAQERNITLDAMILTDAIYLVNQELRKKKF